MPPPSEAAELALGSLSATGALDCTVKLQQAKDSLRVRCRAAAQEGDPSEPQGLLSEEQALYWCGEGRGGRGRGGERPRREGRGRREGGVGLALY